MFLMKVRSRKRERNLRSVRYHPSIMYECSRRVGCVERNNESKEQAVRGGGLRHLDSFYMITPAIFNCIPVDGFELFNHLSNKEGRKTRAVWPPPRAGLAPSPPPTTPASLGRRYGVGANVAYTHTSKRPRTRQIQINWEFRNTDICNVRLGRRACRR